MRRPRLSWTELVPGVVQVIVGMWRAPGLASRSASGTNGSGTWSFTPPVATGYIERLPIRSP